MAGCGSDENLPQPSVNANANADKAGYAYVTDYAMPHLDASRQYVEHTVELNGQTILNYALEWDAAKKHAAWVAYSFDATTRQDHADRTDAWDVDPQLPEGMQTSNADHVRDGFDRGHLCASEDRVYSTLANVQTFYFSNISPQFNSFNGGFWAAFEILVRNWARRGAYDQVYITKGGTLNQLLQSYTATVAGADGIFPQTDANGYTLHGLACPRYYFMAVLARSGERYQSIGFWMEHRDDYGYDYDHMAPVSVLKTYALSIDELEQHTGLDFFCNLPDEVEDQTEQHYAESDWAW